MNGEHIGLLYYSVIFFSLKIAYIFLEIKTYEIQSTYIFNHLSLFINSFKGNIGGANLLCDTTCFTILYMCVTELGQDSRFRFVFQNAKGSKRDKEVLTYLL